MLESFSFDMTLVDQADDPFGIVSSGSFVAPDALTCEAWNPALLGNLGTGIAIADKFWYDDGFFEPSADSRQDEASQEWMLFCPGSHEFWEAALIRDDRITVEYTGPGEAVAGFSTTEYRLAGSGDLAITAGTVLLGPDGWPVRVEMRGTVPGGVFSFFDAAESDEPTDFELTIELSNIGGAQIVRSPDGTIMVGPNGDAIATIEPLPDISPDLGAAVESIRGTACHEDWTLSWINQGSNIERLGFVEISTVSQSEEFESVNNIVPGMSLAGLGWQATTGAPVDDLALLHLEILMNHRAPVMAFLDWVGAMHPDMSKDGDHYLALETNSGETLASWNGYEVTYANGEVTEWPYHYFLAMPHNDQALDGLSYAEAQSFLIEWSTQMVEISQGLEQTDPQAAVNLESAVRDLDRAKAVACLALATAWSRADNAAQTGSDPTDHYIDEIAAQHALLAIEYVELLEHHLDRPRIDWLRGDNLDLRMTHHTGDETTGTAIFFIADLLTEALTFVNPDSWL